MLVDLWSRLAGSHYRYVVVNTLVSVLAFGRNLMFMRTLGLGDLGQVALMHTIVMLIGFAQLGMINGAYILYAERDPVQNRRIVNLMSVGVSALVVVAALLAISTLGALGQPVLAKETVIVGIAAGIASLASTWLNNALIADGALGRSNIINVAAVMVSVGVAFLSLPYGLSAALLAIALQPLIVVIAALVIEPDLRPRALVFDREMMGRILRLGFMPFVGGLFVLGAYQVERWAIVAVLGDEALGRFYLVMMYMTFFVLLPASLLNVFFPRALRAYQGGDFGEFRAIGRRHFRAILAYCLGALLATISAVPFAIREFLPQFAGDEILVYLVYPAMVIFVLRDTASLVLYSVKRTMPILIGGAILLSIYTISIFISVVSKAFSLELLVILRGGATVASATYLMWENRRVLRHVPS
jgi:O-antigen/teichoic acid export membrane protein